MSTTATRWGSRLTISTFDPAWTSFLDNGEVKPASLTRQEALDHVISVKSQSQFVTGHAGLGNHQNGRSDSQTITDAERVFC